MVGVSKPEKYQYVTSAEEWFSANPNSVDGYASLQIKDSEGKLIGHQPIVVLCDDEWKTHECLASRLWMSRKVVLSWCDLVHAVANYPSDIIPVQVFGLGAGSLFNGKVNCSMEYINQTLSNTGFKRN